MDIDDGQIVGDDLGINSSQVQSPQKDKFPTAVYFIIGNEFCERFSFYGMKTVLFVYLTSYLLMTESKAVQVVHSFGMFAYFFPLIGGILGDSYWGKYRTIFNLSLVYCVGNLILAVTSIPYVTGNPPQAWGALIGLLLLAVGTGGIKSNVSSFGGDQFEADQTLQIQRFFSMFYFSINSGSLLSTFVTPELRSMKCFGLDSCFPLAFGVPAVLMVVATVIFVLGNMGGRYKKIPIGENSLMLLYSVVKTALVNKYQSRNQYQRLSDVAGSELDINEGDSNGNRALDNSTVRAGIMKSPSIVTSPMMDRNAEIIRLKKTPVSSPVGSIENLLHAQSQENTVLVTDHWLSYASPAYSPQVIQQVKSVLSVLYMFLPLPFFWTLYDQQSSRWVAQAKKMDPIIRLSGGAEWRIKYDQMQLVNALLILAMIPLFDRIIYPLCAKYLKWQIKPLQRMSIGMFLTGVAFIMAALLEVGIQNGEFDENGFCVKRCVHISLQIPQYVVLTAGEIMFSITGLEFAYSQSPPQMKSVMQACWLLTVAIGNLVVVLLAEATLFKFNSTEYFFFAALIFAAAIVFSLMSLTYKYQKFDLVEDILTSPQDDIQADDQGSGPS
ncbi:hypothetical protein MP228_010426 [Amoeboaphelidium protococcarum]|nr:hypothetical protein MP228_010426 [Amoeboaphelidium protococcarum]